MEKYAGISRIQMRWVITGELLLTKLKKKHLVQVISESSKLKRLDRGKLMLRGMEPAVSKVFIRSDKNMSTVETVTNKQNGTF